MKTKREIPDPVFRKATAESGKPWMMLAGGLRHLHSETVRINKLIEEEFEKIDPEEWK